MARKIFYLASPYNHERISVRRRRHQQAVGAAAGLMALGIGVFSPIVHNHPLVQTGLVATSKEYAVRWRFWRAYDFAMLSRCDGFLILTLPGWEQSFGVSAELRYARKLGRRIGYVEPQTLKISWER